VSAAKEARRRIAVAALAAVLGATLGLLGSRARPQSAGPSMTKGTNDTATAGADIYRQICQGCHMPDGRGAVGAGKYPALAGDRALLSARFMALTLLEGRRNMPAFGGTGQEGFFFITPTLDDEQIAAVINYVRTHFGNHFRGTISAAEVKALRRPP